MHWIPPNNTTIIGTLWDHPGDPCVFSFSYRELHTEISDHGTQAIRSIDVGWGYRFIMVIVSPSVLILPARKLLAVSLESVQTMTKVISMISFGQNLRKGKCVSRLRSYRIKALLTETNNSFFRNCNSFLWLLF